MTPNTNPAPTHHPHHGDDLEAAASLEEEAYAALAESYEADRRAAAEDAG